MPRRPYTVAPEWSSKEQQQFDRILRLMDPKRLIRRTTRRSRDAIDRQVIAEVAASAAAQGITLRPALPGGIHPYAGR
jgi:hypothetical protein